jgi:hypothetical protein
MGEFSESMIRDCVSRMFDNGKQYDNPAAVVKELRAEVFKQLSLQLVE